MQRGLQKLHAIVELGNHWPNGVAIIANLEMQACVHGAAFGGQKTLDLPLPLRSKKFDFSIPWVDILSLVLICSLISFKYSRTR